MFLLQLLKEPIILRKQNVCALIQCAEKFLAVSRIGDHTKFGFPGGKREFGEKEKEALKREVLEETGAVIRVEERIFLIKIPPLIIVLYLLLQFWVLIKKMD